MRKEFTNEVNYGTDHYLIINAAVSQVGQTMVLD